jgi:dTDP-4-dehydrorhamnose reductase
MKSSEMKTVLISGANGQVGQEFQMSSYDQDFHYLFFTREEMDIVSYSNLEKFFITYSPSFFVNLAAFTNTERAEKEEDKAYQVNVIGPRNLANLCKKYQCSLIHVSTDYVFDGTKEEPYDETDETNPLNVYGKSKREGEIEIQKVECNYVVLRTSWVYGNFGNNFYLKMLQLSQKMSEINVIEDQWGSPTSSKELIRAIEKIIEKGIDSSNSGVYHFSGAGRTNWKDFATEIFKLSKIPVIVSGIPSRAYSSTVNRPVSSYMTSSKFSNAFGLPPMHWKNALLEVISEKKISPVKVGYELNFMNEKFIIASVDWSKREAVIANLKNLSEFLTVTFEDLYEI